MGRPRLYINNIPELDRLNALEYGWVDDGQPSERWRVIADQVAFFHPDPEGPARGFAIRAWADFDIEDCEAEEIWTGPTFDVPTFGLASSSLGEIALAARSLLGVDETINRTYFHAAAGESGEAALRLWLACLEAGDSMAHFGLCYTLFELGRVHEAYRHLRHYAELAPAHPWTWCWYGKAAMEIGELARPEGPSSGRAS